MNNKTDSASGATKPLIYPEFMLGGEIPVRRIGYGTSWRKSISKKGAIKILRKRGQRPETRGAFSQKMTKMLP